MWHRYKGFAQFLSLVFLDLIAYYLSLFLAVIFFKNLLLLMNFNFIFAYNLGETVTLMNYMFSFWWIPIVYILVLAFEKLYMVRYPFWEESRVIFKSVSIAVVFIVMTITIRSMYNKMYDFSLFIYLWLFLIFTLPVVRYFGKKVLYRFGLWKESVLIIGAGEKAVSTITGLSNEEHLGYSVLGLLDDDRKKINKVIEINGKKYRIYGKIKNFDKFVNLLKIETVFIADPSVTEEKLPGLVSEIYKHVRRVVIVPDIKGVAIFNSELHYLFKEKLFMIKVNNNLNSDANNLVKRIFDIILSVIGMIFVIPFCLVIAVIIKATSKGPVIFHHKRMGKGGKEFNALKFRTMYNDADKRLKKILAGSPEARKEWSRSFKLKKDPRITPIGKFLRKTSLDELPQVFNILKGEMSIVGPRPVIREELNNFYGNYKSYYNSVFPGLTGLWQVSGRSDKDYSFRIQTDVWYVQNWSLWLDIIIIFKTLPVVIKREGAY